MTENQNTIREKILKGLEVSSKRMIQHKKERDLYLVISKEGKVVKVKAKDL